MTDLLGPANRLWPVHGAPAFVNRILRRLWIECYVLRGWARYLACKSFGHALVPVEYGEILADFYGVKADVKCKRCGWEAAIDRWFSSSGAQAA